MDGALSVEDDELEPVEEVPELDEEGDVELELGAEVDEVSSESESPSSAAVELR